MRTEEIDLILFRLCREFIRPWEGGYVNNPNDSGGPTNFGITQRRYAEHRQKKGLPVHDVRHISMHEVDDIYLEIWQKTGKQMQASVAFMLFNAAVLCGSDRAIRLLQKHVEVVPDGVIGPITQAAAQNADLKAYRDEMLLFYEKIGIGKNRIFVEGWKRRNMANWRGAIGLDSVFQEQEELSSAGSGNGATIEA